MAKKKPIKEPEPEEEEVNFGEEGVAEETKEEEEEEEW